MDRALRITQILAVFLMITALLAAAADRAFGITEAPKMTREELRAMLDNPDLVIIDVRTEKEWRTATHKIRGAVWEDAEEFETWAGKYPRDKVLVLY